MLKKNERSNREKLFKKQNDVAAAIAARHKKTINEVSLRKEKKRGLVYKMHGFALVSDFVGQGPTP